MAIDKQPASHYCRVNVSISFVIGLLLYGMHWMQQQTGFNTLASFKQFLNTADLSRYLSFY